jgi:glyoxylase-like metal-dependent hydrolase (beta-lactamase superfamily II)
MRSRSAGRIRDRLWYLGREETGIYLLEGETSSLIISGGMSYLAPVILRQFHDFCIDESKIRKLLILHAHFDHVGLVPFFKRRYPDLAVYASARAWEILKMPKAIETINSFSRLIAERMGLTGWLEGMELEWRDNLLGRTVSEGTTMDLGGMNIQIFETPGHSSCSISAYVPEMEALFPSDGGGIPYGETIIPSGNSNFTRYQQSLEKLKTLKGDIFCADHYGYVTGQEAECYIARSIDAAGEKRAVIEALFRRTGSIDATVNTLMEDAYTSNPDYFLAPEISAGIYRQTVRHIAAALGEKA